MTVPGKPVVTSVSDPTNVQMDVVEDPRYDVATGYALLANAQRPPVIRGEDLEG
jgi:hypothetical protein